MKFKYLLFFFLPLFINAQSAFISGNDSICNNSSEDAEMNISFNGLPPFNFTFAINGISQAPIITDLNPFILYSSVEGVYSLVSFNDASGINGSVSGSGLVTVLASPTAIIYTESDTISIIYPFANFTSVSNGSISNWEWNFGDNTTNQYGPNVSHSFDDSIAIYQISLIVSDINGCLDTTSSNIWVDDEFWIYIPNSFTPDNDMVNDKFCIEYNGIRENTFLFQVFNSNADLIFNSSNPSQLKCSENGGWNGKSSDNKTEYFLDSYTYELYFQDFMGWKHKKFGNINIIR